MVRQIVLRQKNVLFPLPPLHLLYYAIVCHLLPMSTSPPLPSLPIGWWRHLWTTPHLTVISVMWWCAGPKMWRVTTVHYHWTPNTKYYACLFTNILCRCAGGPNGGWYVFSVERISCDWCQCAITCINLISGYNGIQVLEIFSEYHFREPAKYFLADYFPLKGYPSLNRKSAKIFWNKNFL